MGLAVEILQPLLGEGGTSMGKVVINAMDELGPTENKVLNTARSLLVSKGCCEACVIPAGICKAMQVAAGLALPKDVVMKIIKED